ncbi:MAG: hypothetical protein LW817_06610 [Candidatus Caenarcaniphilales bacterium]|jgi:hypothetical protein|nr:hypothetical protein [Candidatus Caenarcaniphilales bacterium]
MVLIFDDDIKARKDALDLVTKWSENRKVEVRLDSVNATSLDSNLNDDVCMKLLHAKPTGGDKLAIISGGSTNVSNHSKNYFFNKGFIDVLEGLNEFLGSHPSINPFVALRSSWFNKNTEVTEKTKAFTPASLKQLLQDLPGVTRRQSNYEEYMDATIEAVEKAPNEIFTMAKTYSSIDENEKAFFAFLDKAFLA